MAKWKLIAAERDALQAKVDAIESRLADRRKMHRVSRILQSTGYLRASLSGPRPADAMLISDLEEIYTDAATRAEAAESEVTRLREALTPSGDTKAAYFGKFYISVYDAEDEDGNEIWRDVPVDWTTIKAIMATIMSRAALTPPADLAKGGDA